MALPGLPKGLRRFQVSSVHPDVAEICPPITIVASTPESAWAKFRKQHFGALKPLRADWDVAELERMKSEPDPHGGDDGR